MAAITPVTGAFTAAAQTAGPFTPKDSPLQDPGSGGVQSFNFSVFGTFVGTVVLEKSFDAGTTWIQVFDRSGAAISTTTPKTIIVDEPEDSVQYRARCSAYTSGTANVRLSR